MPTLQSRTWCDRDIGLSSQGLVWALHGKLRWGTHFPPAQLNSGFLPPRLTKGALLHHCLYFVRPQRKPVLRCLLSASWGTDHDLQRWALYIFVFLFEIAALKQYLDKPSEILEESRHKRQRNLEHPLGLESGVELRTGHVRIPGTLPLHWAVAMPLNLHEQKLRQT